MGAGGGRGGEQERTGHGPEARKGLRRETQGHWRQGGRWRRQDRVHEGGGADPGSTGGGTRTACGQAAQDGARHQVTTSAHHVDPVSMADRALVLQRHRRLKWRAFDFLEAILMVLCGICIFMFTLSVGCDVVTRTIGRPWLWLQ